MAQWLSTSFVCVIYLLFACYFLSYWFFQFVFSYFCLFCFLNVNLSTYYAYRCQKKAPDLIIDGSQPKCVLVAGS